MKPNSPIPISSFKSSIKREDFETFFHLNISSLENDYQQVSEIESSLSEVELAYLNSITHRSRKQSFLMGRYLSKILISKELKLSSFGEVNVSKGAFGQPIIEVEVPHNLKLSISHSKKMAASLIFEEKHPMAIDIEDEDLAKLKVLNKQMSESEKARFSNLGLSEISSLTLMWTLKESVSKVIQTGMTSSMELYEIKSVEKVGHYYVSRFKNLSQYKGVSLKVSNSWLSLVMPYKSEINSEINLKL